MADRLRREHRFTVVPEPLTRDQTISDRAFRLWCLLDRYAGRDEAAFPSRRRLGADLGCSRATVDRALSELIESGWLTRESRKATGETSLYTLTDGTKHGAPKGGDAPVSQGGDAPMTQGGDAPVEHPRLTSDAPGDAHVQQGRLMGESLKEASPEDASPKDPGDSLPSQGSGQPAADPRGSRLPEDWWPNEHLRSWFESQPWSHLIQPGHETAKFKDYWLAKAGKDARKVDWGRTWQNWMRTAAERAPGNRPGSNVHQLPTNDPDRQRRASVLGGAGHG